jgi:archaellum component FlaC
VFGLPVPDVKIDLAGVGKQIGGVGKQIGEAGRQFGKLASEVQAVREKAEQVGSAFT